MNHCHYMTLNSFSQKHLQNNAEWCIAIIDSYFGSTSNRKLVYKPLLIWVKEFKKPLEWMETFKFLNEVRKHDVHRLRKGFVNMKSGGVLSRNIKTVKAACLYSTYQITLGSPLSWLLYDVESGVH